MRGDVGGVATLSSIALGARSTDATGASGKGLPTPLQDNDVGLILKFSDRSVHAVNWSPY